MKIEIEVPDQYINGALAAPHSRYWASEAVWDPTHQVGRVVERDGANGKPETHILYPSKLKTALEFMARRYPVPFAHLQAGNYDGPIGDLLLQLIAFGPAEVKYG
jgi:hypothetical protein